jgi:TetR/AcrR family transcriptional regulator of autoinduction and epiphytic fitness
MGRRPRIDREAVLAAARRLFGERGYEGTTLAAIAAEVGVSPAALLRHAPTKQALFDAAFGADPGELTVPIEFLARVDAAKSDPAKVLTRVGESFVPFFERVIGQTMALWMRTNALAGAAPENLPLVFDRARRPTPPQRALALLENYFRRATRAGRLRARDPRAAAVVFLGALQAYVMLHRVARAIDPPMALSRYLEALVDLLLPGLGARAGREKG